MTAEAQQRNRSRLERFAVGRWALVVFLFLGVALAAASSYCRGFPPPEGQDAFSYLLGSDTFAHGRLTNPTHPLWRHFETIHVLQRPSYASKFPPGQALALALGQAVTGHPITGVWFTFGLMCAALLWMLSAWTEPRWALATAAALSLAIAPTYWASGYWGGCVAATAGALLYGAARRLVDAPNSRPDLAVVIGLALAVLANSRPYEGLIASIPVAALLLAWLVRRGESGWAYVWVAFALPLAATLLAAGAAMLTYNHDVTGRWLTMPYMEYQRQYEAVPLFNFMSSGAIPVPPNNMFRSYQAWEMAFPRPSTLAGYFSRAAYVVAVSSRFFLPQKVLWFAFAALPFAVRDRRTAFLATALAFAMVSMSLSSWFDWHYAAPVLGVYAALWIECLRRISGVRIGRVTIGRLLATLGVAILGFGGLQGLLIERQKSAAGTIDAATWTVARRNLLRALEQRGGRDLVLISYAAGHFPLADWVYNPADIDRSCVVLARDLGPGENQDLLGYYQDRRIWHLLVRNGMGAVALEPLNPGSPAWKNDQQGPGCTRREEE